MELFLETILSFPTVIFTVCLFVATVFWLLSAFGLFDLDSFVDLDVDADIGMDVQGGMEGPLGADAHDASLSGLTGLLYKLKLHEIPLTITFSVVTLVAWSLSFFVQMLLLAHLPGMLRHLSGAVLAVAALAVALPAASIICRPLRPLFRKLEAPSHKSMQGQTAVVRSGRVDEKFGEAVMNDGGAGLLLKVRTAPGVQFRRGDRVVLLEYLGEQHAWRVIAEDEFRGC